MLNKILYFLFIFIISTNTYANSNFSKKATSKPVLIQKGEEKHWCPVCGMSIKKFYKTSHTSTLQNGTPRQYCSIRCLAKDKEEYGIDSKNIKVINTKTEKLINAKSAFYVVGSKIPGTMSKVSKLAFEKKEDAKEFIKKYKGKLVTFDEALKIAQSSLKKDDKILKRKKKKKIYPKGKKIFEKRCNQDIDPSMYLEINELKADIKNNKLCKKLNESQFQAVSLYLWDIKRFGNLNHIENPIEIEETDKCPVCGMFVAKYPRWVAQIIYVHGDHEHKFSFDGVKDLMKFYFDPKRWLSSKNKHPISKEKIKNILVTDYYSQKPIDGSSAFYVIGSDVYGPMGHELIPFEDESDAKTFKKDHIGTKIIKFDKINEEEVYKLDE